MLATGLIETELVQEAVTATVAAVQAQVQPSQVIKTGSLTVIVIGEWAAGHTAVVKRYCTRILQEKLSRGEL